MKCMSEIEAWLSEKNVSIRLSKGDHLYYAVGVCQVCGNGKSCAGDTLEKALTDLEKQWDLNCCDMPVEFSC